MVGNLPQDVPKSPDAEGCQQRPPEGPGAPRPLMTRLQEMRASQGRRQLQGEPRDTTDLQIHLQRLKVRQDLRPTPAREERSLSKSDHLPEDSLPRRVALQERRALHMRLQEERAKREERAFQKVREERVLQEVREERVLQAKLQEVQEERVLQEVREERALQASLQELQEKLEQKQKEHVDMCRKVQEVRVGRLWCSHCHAEVCMGVVQYLLFCCFVDAATVGGDVRASTGESQPSFTNCIILADCAYNLIPSRNFPAPWLLCRLS